MELTKRKLEDENDVSLKSNNNEPEGPCQKKPKSEELENNTVITTNNETITIQQQSASLKNEEAERRVGMTFCINKTKFQGIIKQRYSDFMVRELDVENRQPIYMTSTDHVDGAQKRQSDGNEVGDGDKSETAEAEDKKEEVLPPCPVQDEELVKKIDDFAKSETEETISHQITFVNNDKENRRLCHLFFKMKYPNLETDVKGSKDDPSNREMVICYKKGQKSSVHNREQSKRGGNQSNSGNNNKRKQPPKKFCHFVLVKQNKDTMDCINFLAQKMRINPREFSYAGTKDRRATTIQRVAVRNTLSTRLHHMNSWLRNIVLGDFRYQDNPLQLGDLAGNEFTLIVRDVSGGDDDEANEKVDEADVEKACCSLRDHGFVNYFGLQRFGTGGSPTHEIGKALLKDDFKEACHLILAQPQADDTDRTKERAALKIWADTRDAKLAFSALRFKHGIEGKLLNYLGKNSNDYLGAFGHIPRNTRLLYLHSYQSLVWNKAVSHRLENYGMASPVIGDLVLKPEKDSEGYIQAVALTADDISSNKFTIEDVVMPLPGYDVIYPEHESRDFVKGLLESDGLDITDMRRKQKDCSLSGAYRSILIKPKKMSWELIRYDDYTIPLIHTELDKIEEQRKASSTRTDWKSKSTNGADGPSVVQGGEQNGAQSTASKDSSDDANSTAKIDTKMEVDDKKNQQHEQQQTVDEKTPVQQQKELEQINDNKATKIDAPEKNDTENDCKKEEMVEMNDGGLKTSDTVVEGKFLALKLQFELPPSCYATTALRELLSCDSSYQAQTRLNANFNKKSGRY